MLPREIAAVLVVALFGLTAFGMAPTPHPSVGGGGASFGPLSGGGAPTLTAHQPAVERMILTHPSVPPSVTLIYPNGSIGGASGPITQNGSRYEVTGEFTGAIWDERNGSTLDGHGFNLSMGIGLTAAIWTGGTVGVSILDFRLNSTSDGIQATNAQDLLIRGNTVNGSGAAVRVQYSTNVTIGNNSGPGMFYGIYDSFDNGVAIEDNTVPGAASGAIFSTGSTDVHITNNRANNSANGIYVNSANRAWILGNNVSFSQLGMDINGVTSATVDGNVASNCVGTGIAYQNVLGLSSSNNDARHSQSGISVYSSTDAALSGEDGSFAVYASAQVASSRNVSIVNSTFMHAGTYGLYSYYTNGLTLLGDNLSYYNISGVYVQGSSNLLFSENRVLFPMGTTSVAFQLYANGGVQLRGNIAFGAPRALSEAQSHQVNISGNDFSQSNGTLQAISISYDSDVVIGHNDVSRAGWTGIFAYESHQVIIEANNATSCQATAVDVDSSDSVTIVGNNADGSGGWALILVRITNFWAADNSARNGTDVVGVGLDLSYGMNGTVSNNSLVGNDYSLFVEYSSSITALGNNVSRSGHGLYLFNDRDSLFAGNTAISDGIGFTVSALTNTSIYHNNFINDSSWDNRATSQSIRWDDGYPGGGNYWSNLTAPDASQGPGQNLTGPDGIVDVPMTINVSNFDLYPLTTPWHPSYLKFTETGLAPGTSWEITVDGTTVGGTGGLIAYPIDAAATASFHFTVGRVAGYHAATPSSGSGTSARVDQTIPIAFSAFTFNVTFQETGLPDGTVWGMTFAGQPVSSNSSTLTVTEPNGSYSYSVHGLVGYVIPANVSGTVTLSGSGATVQVPFFSTSLGNHDGGGGTGTTTSGYSPAQFFGVLGLALVFGVLAILGMALWRSARRPRQPGAEGSQSMGSAPPASPSPPEASGRAPPPGAT